MQKALIFGRFEPFHNMHLTLVHAVRALGYEIEFCLFNAPNIQISVETRSNWLSRFSNVTVLPVGAAGYDEIDLKLLPDAHLVAGSNPELLKISQALNLPHFLWDPKREAWDLDAQKVMQDPLGHWQDMPDFVRKEAQKRITFVGPESVGKSWFAQKMATKFGGPHIPEYGRPHEAHRAKGEYTIPELVLLAKRHAASREALSRLAGAVVFEDTDELMTAVWSEMLLGKEAPEVEAMISPPNLYVLYHWDTPWEEDKLRYFARADLRKSFFERIERKLQKHNAKYITIGGSWEEREAETLRVVEEMRAQVAFTHKPQD